MTRPYVRGAELARFWPKVDQTGECWLWTAATNDHGYGIFRTSDGRNVRAHRWAWEQERGAVPEGMVLDHLCHDHTCTEGGPCLHRRCVRPDHLAVTTRSTNSRRQVPGGRTWRSEIAACPQGHPYDEANTYTYRGSRLCKACRSSRRS